MIEDEMSYHYFSDRNFSLEQLCYKRICRDWKYIFKITDWSKVYMPVTVASKLFYLLNHHEYGAREDILGYFSKERCSLDEVQLNCYRLKDADCLKFLENQTLKALEVIQLNGFSLSSWIRFVNPEKLEKLAIRNCFICPNENEWDKSNDPLADFFRFDSFKNLLSLDISFTNSDDKIIGVIGNILPQLTELNIRGTKMKNSKCLLPYKNLRIIDCSYLTTRLNPDFSSLPLLKNLVKVNVATYSTIKVLNLLVQEVLEEAYWPELRHLELSGNGFCSKSGIISFIERHTKLEFLGLIGTTLAQFLLDIQNAKPSLKVCVSIYHKKCYRKYFLTDLSAIYSIKY